MWVRDEWKRSGNHFRQLVLYKRLEQRPQQHLWQDGVARLFETEDQLFFHA